MPHVIYNAVTNILNNIIMEKKLLKKPRLVDTLRSMEVGDYVNLLAADVRLDTLRVVSYREPGTFKVDVISNLKYKVTRLA